MMKQPFFNAVLLKGFHGQLCSEISEIAGVFGKGHLSIVLQALFQARTTGTRHIAAGMLM
jgi:hypothetical protein